MKKLLLAVILLTSCQKDEQVKPKQTEQWITQEGSLVFYLSTHGLPATNGMDLYVNGHKIDNYKLKYNYAPDCGAIKCYTFTDTISHWVLWEAREIGTTNIKGSGELLQVGECNKVIIN